MFIILLLLLLFILLFIWCSLRVSHNCSLLEEEINRDRLDKRNKM